MLTNANITVDQLESFISILPKPAALYEISESSHSFLNANDSFFNLLGYSKEDFALQENDFQRIFDNSLTETFQKIHSDLNRKIFSSEKNAVITKKGNIPVSVNLSIQCLNFGNGKILAYIVFSPSETLKPDFTPEVENSFSLSEKKELLDFINKVPGGLFVFYVSKKFTSVQDIKAFIVYANKTYFDILYEPQEDLTFLKSQSILTRVHPDDIPMTYTKYLEAATDFKQKEINLLLRSLCGDNSYHWFTVKAKHISENSEYNIFYASIFNSDAAVEKNRQLQSKYFSEKEKWTLWEKERYLFCSCNLTKDTLLDFYFFKSSEFPDFSPASYNEARAFLLSLISDEKTKEKIIELSSKENLFANYLKGKLLLSFQFQQRIAKNLTWVELSFSLLKQPDTKDVICYVSLSNIDEKKQTESILQRLVSIDYDNVIIVSTKDETCNFISNRNDDEIISSLSELKYSHGIEMYFRRNFIGSDLEDFLEKISLKNVLSALKNQSIFMTTYAIKGSGQIKSKKMLFTFTDSSQQYLCVVLQDITNIIKQEEKQQKLLQDALKNAEKANCIKQDFLAHISYDVRTPLNAISGIINLAKDVKNNPKEIQYFLDQIDTSCQIMTGLFNDVIDMSQIENGFFELHPESYFFEDFVKLILLPIHSQCKEKNISFFYDATNPFPPLKVDKQRFNQIFYNLFANALKYTREGSSISFEIQNKKVENNLFLADFIVSDNGSLFKENQFKQIKELFAKEKISEIYNSSSVGLGLSIVKIFVTLLGGKITIASNSNKGTIFTISLAIPVAQIVNKSLETKTFVEDFSMLAGKKVLLVEDNFLNRDICCRQLEKKQINVIQAVNGEEALNIFKNSEPGTFNAILMDIQMPVMNGYEAAKAIRLLNRPDAVSTPIIAMSADGFIENIKASLSAGMVAHLTKPITLEKLYGTLAAFCTS